LTLRSSWSIYVEAAREIIDKKLLQKFKIGILKKAAFVDIKTLFYSFKISKLVR